MKIMIIPALVSFAAIGYGQEDTTAQVKSFEEIEVQGEKRKGELPSIGLQQLTDDYLEDQPGVTLISRGNYAKEPTIRGLNAGQINMTIDGMQIFGACTDRMDPISSYVEPTNMQSIRLSFGPNGQDLSSSIGGGFDFRLRKAELASPKRFSGNLGTGYESNGNAFQALGTVHYSSKKWALMVNSIYRRSDNYASGRNMEVPYSQYEKWNLSASGALALSKSNRLYLSYLQDDGYNIGYPALTMDVAFAKAKIASLEHQYHNTDNRLFHWESKLYWNFIDHAMDDTRRPPEEVAMHMDMPGTSLTLGAYSGGSMRIGNKHVLKMKASGYMNDLHAEMTMYPDNGAEMFMLTIPDARRFQMGLNVSDKYLITRKLHLLFGGRIDHNQSSITSLMGRQTLTSVYTEDPDKSFFLWNASAALHAELSKKIHIHASVERGMRSPTLQEMYGFYLFNRMDNHDYLGNPDLKPESSLNFSIGMKTKLERIEIHLQGFMYLFRNYIAGIKLPDYSVMTMGAGGVKQYGNLDKAYLTGGEATIKWKIVKDLSLESANSVTYGVDYEGNYLPFIPPFRSVNRLTYQLRGYQFQLTHIGSLAQNNVSTERYGELPSKAFNLLHFGVGKEFQLRETKLRGMIKLENIFDEVYYEHLDIMKVNRPGRNLSVQLTWSF